MVLAEDLRQAVLQAALQGKLTNRLESDSSVEELLNRIQSERKRLLLEKKIKKISIKPIQPKNVPYDIPSNWRWQRIGSFEEINLGFTYRPQYVNEGVYFLSVKDISSGKIDFSNAKKVSQETYDKASYGSKPRKGDILFGRVCTMGKPQIIESDIPFCIFVSLGFFREHTNLMNKEYIAYWMQSPLFYDQVNENVKGSAQKNLNTGWLKDFFVPIPPAEEQQRIVDKINEIMPKIDEYEKIEKELVVLKKEFPINMKDALLQAALQGKLTEQLESDGSVNELLDHIKKEKEELIAQKKIKKEKPLPDIEEEEIPFEIPANWRWVRLKNICTKIVDGDHNPPHGVLEKTRYLMLSAQNINFDKLIDLDQARYLTKKDFEQENLRTQVKSGDIFFTIVGTLGRSCVYTGGYNISFQRSVAVISTCIYNRYLKRVLDSPYIQQYMVTKATGTAQKGFYLNQVDGLLVPLPPMEEQQRIVERLDALLPLCEDLKEV